ncbi:MAG: GNAT family N-acetyltransferase [Bdellovibrionaceae bacterium]|nr:GNAT family N-acetyltransferase [Bdellovibrio sp.]
MKFGFEILELQVAWAICGVRNAASSKVMEKINMKRVGHLIKHKEYKGGWHDSYRYEITLPDYSNNRKNLL